MKHRLLATAAVLALAGTTTFAFAKGPDGKGPHRGGHHGGGIAALDTDGDGRISRAEFAAGEAKHAERAAAREARRAESGKPARERAAPQRPTFEQLDANRDGTIVRREVEGWHERMRPQREAQAQQRRAERFAEADLNRDGRLSRAEVEEKMPRLAQRFAWLDDDRDGFLSQQDLRGRGQR